MINVFKVRKSVRKGTFERRVSLRQLEQKHPQGPDINLFIVRFVKHDLRSHVIEGPTVGTLQRIGLFLDPCPPEIRDLDISTIRNQKILRLQIPMNYFVTMQIIQSFR